MSSSLQLLLRERRERERELRRAALIKALIERELDPAGQDAPPDGQRCVDRDCGNPLDER